MDKSSGENILSVLSAKQRPRVQRRFDTLARLLESNMTCAAVCLIDRAIYITTNDIYAGFSGKDNPKPIEPTTQGFVFLKKATSRFLSDEFQKKDEYTKEDREIILANFRGKSATYYKGQQGAPNLNDTELDSMIEYLLKADSTQDFMDSDTPLNFFEKFIIPDKKVGKEERGIVKKSERFRKSLEVQQTFNRLWRDVRDYRKFKEMVRRNHIIFDECKILCVGQKDEHAEMRILGYLLNKPGVFSAGKDDTLEITEPLYLGISKLCCPYCVVTLNIFNENLSKGVQTNEESIVFQVGDESLVEEDELHSSESLRSASEQALAKEIEWSIKLVGTRGSHALRFNWVVPAFARKGQFQGHWPCKMLARWSDLPKKTKKNTVYFVKKGTHEIYRCKLLMPNSCITYQGKGTGRRFSVSPSLIELGVPKQHFDMKEEGLSVNSQQLQTGVESYYCSGFCPQVVTLRLGDDLKTIRNTCELLKATQVGQNVSTCLGNRNFGETLLTAYQAECDKVVELTEEVRMVASTSSSSVGGSIKESNFEKVLSKDISEFRLVDIDEESEHAEEGSDILSSQESDRQNGVDSTEESNEESSSYKPP